MLLLRNPIQPYAWGPVDGISDLLGSEPTGGHEAELWIGTHPRGPSVVVGGEHDGRSLAAVVAEDPVRWLGRDLAASGATALPFLLKVLAIGAPLSLQAHPSAAQAAAGYEREEAAGIASDAPNRLYADPHPKPEMLVALADTWTLCGFRPPLVVAELVASAGVRALDPLVEGLGAACPEGDRLRDALEWLLHLEGDARAHVAAGLSDAAERRRSGDRDDPWHWVAELAASYPGDPLCAAPLLLELVRLAPGEAVHLPAGNLHAYLHGVGVEVMAASDNVLRGGLTPKYVDVDELLAVLAFEVGLPDAPPPTVLGRWTQYDPNEPAFELAVEAPDGGGSAISSSGPLVLLATGPSEVRSDREVVEVAAGQAVLVEPGVVVQVAGSGAVWCATVGGGLQAHDER